VKIDKLGLIAGNGRFPFLVLEEALAQKIPVVVAAIREETSSKVDEYSNKPGVSVQWLGLGQLGKLIRLFQDQGVKSAIMAGQVKHVQIFSRKGGDAAAGHHIVVPDRRMMKVFFSIPARNTKSLIGGVMAELEKEGIELLSSTVLLQPLMAKQGVLTRRSPRRSEQKDIDYGRPVAREIARLDLGQTIVVKDQAVVAVEVMEGTDETIRRASRLVGGGKLTVIKVGRPDQDMRFDVPVVGLDTLSVLEECNVSALAIDPGTTLVLDRDAFVASADRLKITVVAS